MNEEKIEKSINEETDVQKLRAWMENAQNQGRDDVYRQAFRRLCELAGVNHEDPMEKDFWGVIAAYEECLFEKHNKAVKANRTRPGIEKKGFKQCLIDWAQDTGSTPGFDLLIERGMFELTGEFLVIKYKEQFDETVVASARRRLEEAGVDL